MRLNKYLALATGLSRRAADAVIAEQRVRINEALATIGEEVNTSDQITLDGKAVRLPQNPLTILLNKPIGYVCSRNGQGSPTIYELLPEKYHALKPIGRLDKDSSGLLLLTNDGTLAQQLTHPSFQKDKTYQITLDKPLSPAHQADIKKGVELEDGTSHLRLKSLDQTGRSWQVTMQEGRNRQIRRTFAVLSYSVTKLHRTHFGPYSLGPQEIGTFHLLQ